MTHALDISHFTQQVSGDLTPEKLERCQEREVERFVVSIADQQIARKQIEALVPYGFEIQTYRYYYWNSMQERRLADEAFIADIRRNAYDIQFHWLDHEDTSVRRPVDDNERDIQDMINWWTGKCATGIYTAAWWWNDYMKGSTAFSFMPLWFAHWDWQETLDLAIPFGGWTRGVMKQTQGDFYLDDMIWCDTNYYEKVELPPPPPPPPPIDLGIIKDRVQVIINQGTAILEELPK